MDRVRVTKVKFMEHGKNAAYYSNKSYNSE
jgi:hypothetical protein